MRYKRFLNYFDTFISVTANYLINNLNKMGVNYFNKHLSKTFINVNIINYFDKLKVNITTKIIEINIYEDLSFFIIENTKPIVNNN